MTLAEFIRGQRQDCRNAVIEPIVEELSKYLAKELKNHEHAYVRWVYEKSMEDVNENHAFVYYERKVALYGWLSEQGFTYWDAVCHLNGQITGIKVSL